MSKSDLYCKLFRKFVLLGSTISFSILPFDVWAQAPDPNPVVIDAAEALAMDARKYADAFGVSFPEALRRMTIMLDTDSQVATVQSEEGADFGGSYFDNRSPEFALVVKTKKAAKGDARLVRKGAARDARFFDKQARVQRRADRKAARSKLKLSDTDVEMAEDAMTTDSVAAVRYLTSSARTRADLEAAGVAALGQLKTITGFQLWYLDEISSEIVILVDATSPAQANDIAQKALNVPFRVGLRPGGVQLTAYRGGQVPSTATSPRYCMTAFGVKHNTAKTATGVAQTGVVTAEHCISSETISLKDPANGASYPLLKGSFIGILPAGSGVSKGDIRFLYNDRGGSSQFYFDNSGAVRTATGTRTRATTSVATGTAVGSFVCHLGQASPGSASLLQSCGEVISKTAYQSYDSLNNIVSGNVGGSFVVLRNTASGAGTVGPTTGGGGTLRCYRGDSGGPVFAGTIAFGVASSCSWYDFTDGTVAELVYTSTDQFVDVGVTLLVN